MWGVEGERGRGKRGWGGGEIKAALYSLMWLLCAGSSQLLLQGLLHLHFSLKIAPVIIYLAGARHPTLCAQRIVCYFALYKSLSPVLCLVFGVFFHQRYSLPAGTSLFISHNHTIAVFLLQRSSISSHWKSSWRTRQTGCRQTVKHRSTLDLNNQHFGKT